MGATCGNYTVLSAHIQPIRLRQPLPGEECELAQRFDDAGIPAQYESCSLRLRIRRWPRQKPRRVHITPDFVIETGSSNPDDPAARHYMLLIEVKRNQAPIDACTKLLAMSQAFRDRRIESMMLVWEPKIIYTTMPDYGVERLLWFLGFEPSEWTIKPLTEKARSLKSWSWQMAA